MLLIADSVAGLHEHMFAVQDHVPCHLLAYEENSQLLQAIIYKTDGVRPSGSWAFSIPHLAVRDG